MLIAFLLALMVEAAEARAVERAELLLADGSRHHALLSLPQNLKSRLPVIFVLGGFDTGEKSISLLPDNSDVIYATTDYPYKSPQERSFVKDLKQIPAIRKAVHKADLAVDALIKKLLSDPRVDSKRLIMVGASFGAPFTITAAVRNPELSGVVLIHAFGRLDRAIEQQLVNEWGGWSRPLARILGWSAWNYLSYKEPEKELRNLHAHQKVLYIYSTEDDQLPKISIESFQAGIRESPAKFTTVTNTGGHLGPGKNEMIAELVAISMKWLKSENLL